MWRWPEGTLIHQFRGHGAPARGALFLPGTSNRIVTAARDGTVRLWDRVSGDEVAVIHTQRAFPQNVAAHPDGTEIAVCFDDKDAQFFRCVPTRDRLATSNPSAMPER